MSSQCAMVIDMSRQWPESTVVLSRMQMLNNPLSKTGETDIPSDMFQWEYKMTEYKKTSQLSLPGLKHLYPELSSSTS